MSGFAVFALGIFLFVVFNRLWCFWCRSKVCLVGKTALITGGASGIGFQTALALVSKGCRVIIADVANLPEAVEKIKKISHNPHIIECSESIDCQGYLHITIVSPVENEHVYANRKNFHSFNICDENLKITNVFARYPGSTHDSFIWRHSNIEQFLRTMPEDQIGSFYLLGKHLDLRSFDLVRKFAKEIIETEPKLDILLCNAGIGDYRIRTFTPDGLERTMQVNFFSHFLLTHLLLDLLKKSAPARIIFTSSITAYVSDLTLKNLNPDPDYYQGFFTKMNGGTYSNSKLCLAAASKIFAEKLKGTGVTVNAVLPGGVQTPIWAATKREFNFIGFFVTCLVYLYGKTSEQGAQTLIHVAHSDEVETQTGQFFYEGMRFLKPFRLTDKFCKEIWKASVECTKLQAHELKW